MKVKEGKLFSADKMTYSKLARFSAAKLGTRSCGQRGRMKANTNHTKAGKRLLLPEVPRRPTPRSMD